MYRPHVSQRLRAQADQRGRSGGFFRGYLGHRFASTKQAASMTERFVTSIRDFLQRHGVPLVRFQKGQRKDAVFQQRLKQFKAPEGVVFVGVAQEKARVPRTIRKHFGQAARFPGSTTPRPWSTCTTSTAWTRTSGRSSSKFCSYFPYTAKLCLNGMSI